MFWFKLKAGALQLTLFITVVIALLLTAFILFIQTHKRFNIQTDFIIETAKNTDSGISHALNNIVPLNDTTSINLNGEDFKTLNVHREFWGVFEKVTTISKIKKNIFKRTALIGAAQSKNNRTVLYVQDNNKPLVLVGNTKIEGVAYLPKRGVKNGNISGHSYYGSQLIYGPTKTSTRLPKIFSETKTQIKEIENLISKIEQNQFINLKVDGSYKNSFLKPVQVIFSNETIVLNAIQLTGNIIVQSKAKIIINASCTLKDIVLIAPEIEIKNNVKGNFQAIASKNILVGNNVLLEYPSALALTGNVAEKPTNLNLIENNRIIIDDDTIIKGLVLYLGVSKPNNHDVQVELKEKSKIIGEVYCNQNLELKGTVFGTVYTNNFIARQFGSIYQNHIYNGKIKVSELPEKYVGLPFNNSKKSVLKWLY
ncbi:hypothetical protein BZARG_385 [Bizionia argentinensis JUB59]|uniref:Polymer-forming cytoskeletal protein n=1 Tax=Bizionia argentinensis JUB59 TaxID=1046627 RepID=G2EGZ8_9FLAO|nr:hypothetical protein [Bizionia argentinensis]EGV42210.1 hypothetical protein BZARG_385 [Bizionia argentinensis JUB59]